MQLELSLGASESAGIMEVVRDRRLRGPVLVGCGVNLSMQLSGIDAVLYYSTKVLQDAGIELEWAQVYTVLISLVNVLVTIPAMMLMDKAGRKVIQSLGLGGMCVAYLTMTVALVTGQHLLAVGAMFGVVCCFAFGPGCIAWFIVSELTPVHVRGFATTVGLGANWMANFLVAFTFPHVLAALRSWTFGIFAASTLLLTLFTLACLPETKGRTVAEISEFFAPPKASVAAGAAPKASVAAAASAADPPSLSSIETKLPRSESWHSDISTAPSNATSSGLATPLLSCE